MAEPVRIAALITHEERTGACADCGAELQQSRITSEGKALDWRPARCEPCSERHLAERQADQAQAKARDEQERRRIVEVRTAEKRDTLLDALGCPPRYARATLDSFELHGSPADQSTQNRALIMAKRYCSDWPHPPHETLILRGGPGTGKGHLAWSVAKYVCEMHLAQVKNVKLADMVRRLRSAWRKSSDESEETILDEFRAPSLLVIDEVSRHAFYGEQIHQHLYDVLDHRIEQMRPTILTTNETDQGLAEILRPALLDRVLGTGGIAEFGTASYRARPRVAS